MKTSEADLPLVVDLDGSLLKTDSLWECFFRVLATRPWRLTDLLIKFLTSGRAAVKCELAQQLPLREVEYWPYDQQVIDVINAAKKAGRKICLATAANQRIAGAVAAHLGFFDLVIASSDKENLKGLAKLDALNKQFGERKFAYLGDSSADLPIWENCGQAIVTGFHASSLKDKIASRQVDVRLIPREGGGVLKLSFGRFVSCNGRKIF